MATRKKEVVLSGITKEQAEEAMAAYASAEAKNRKIQATIDGEIIKIRDKYASAISETEEAMESAFGLLKSYAQDNRAELFATKRSVETPHGTFGLRTGTPKLKTRKGFTWASVMNLLREFLPDYVRTTEEIAKDRLLADSKIPEVEARFVQVGIYVDQDETFFVQPKKETE